MYHFFRRLSEAEDCNSLADLFIDRAGFANWAEDYRARLQTENIAVDSRQRQMCAVNPKYILRNYLAQQAIELAQAGDYSEVKTLHDLLQKPCDDQPEFDDYAAVPPDWARHIDLSCSS